MTTQFKVTDFVRLDIRDEWPDLVNIVPNPSALRGTWGWKGYTAAWNVAYIFEALTAPRRFRFGVNRTADRNDFTMNTVTIPIQPVTGVVHARAAITVTATTATSDEAEMRLYAVDAAGVETEVSSEPIPRSTGTYLTDPAALPVGTVGVFLHLIMVNIGSIGSTTTRDFNDVVIVTGSADEVAAASMTAEPAWTNIVGPTASITIERDVLNLSPLTARVLDASLDPATSPLIRRGKPLRVQALVNGQWETIYPGTVHNGKTTYQVKDPMVPEQKRVDIALTGVDPVAKLANAPRPNGVGTIDELSTVLANTGVPWFLNGSSVPVVPDADVTIVTVNENASAVDQVAVTRDSVLGYAWIDRDGFVEAWDRAEIPGTVAAVLDESNYSDIDIDFDLERCINTVRVRLVRINPGTGETEEIEYGPFVDPASVRKWGTLSATFTVQGIADDEIEAYAQEILTANSTPAVRINSVTLPVRTVAELEAYALLDQYDLVTVSNDRGAITQTARVLGVQHQITARASDSTWTVTLGFVADGSVATPQVIPSPSVGGGRTLAQLLRPVGEVTMWFGAEADIPAGWLSCDGSSFDGDTYPELAALLGGTDLPDFTDRFPIGAGSKALGTSGGSPEVTLSVSQLPAHTHAYDRSATAGSDPVATFARGGAPGATVQSSATGSGDAIDVLNPWLSLWFIIRAA